MSLNQTEFQDDWFSRARTEADKGVPTNERASGVALFLVGVFLGLYFMLHQVWSTGFFTARFGMLEMFLLYGSLIAWLITSGLEGIFGQRLLSRLFDVFGGILFIAISFIWLLAIFPFEFIHFADVLPDFLRFLVQWMSNDIARGLMVIGIFVLAIAAIYSPVAYKFVRIERSKSKRN
ncbi:MAG: hypothetical protein JSV35_08260 [Candidatus Bathyarchaeota archaeon]|nr:MAG: hypothetical protein JSV35_08260 [Candidatus Bathyarchaeota archaeon]